MSLSFSFDFLSNNNNNNNKQTQNHAEHQGSRQTDTAVEPNDEQQQPQQKRPPFFWWSPSQVGQGAYQTAMRRMPSHTEIPVVLPSSSTATTTTTTTAARDEPPDPVVAAITANLACVDCSAGRTGHAAEKAEDTTDTNDSAAAATTHWRHTDRQPAVYEGGMKVWECSLDLVHYLAEQLLLQQQQPAASGSRLFPWIRCNDDADDADAALHILELGCGHGLPSCFWLRTAYILSQQQQQQQQQQQLASTAATTSRRSIPTFYLTDFNDFVIRDATLVNLVLNTVPAVAATTNHANDTTARDASTKEAAAATITQPSIAENVSNLLQHHVRLGHGDWLDMSLQLLPRQQEHDVITTSAATPQPPPDVTMFQVIMAAETTYSDQSAHDTAWLLRRHLKQPHGIAWVATKRYYFGVGGGSDAFLRAAATCDLQVETIRVFDNGHSNIRELLQVTHKRKLS